MQSYEPDIRGLIRQTLLSVWDGSQVDALIDAFAGTIQNIEDMMAEMGFGLDLPAATGLFLDILGGLFGEPRGTLSDVEYRDFIIAKSIALSARGTIPEVRDLVQTLSDGEVRALPVFPASYEVEILVNDPLIPPRRKRIRRILDLVTPAGVGSSVVEASSESFQFDNGSLGFDTGKLARKF